MYRLVMNLNNLKKIYSGWLMFLGIPLPNYGFGIRLRGALLSPLLKNAGKNLKLGAMVNVYNPSYVAVGNDVYIGYGTYIGDGDITIEDEVVIGPHCSITPGNHRFKNGSVRFGGFEYDPIKIGRGSWIGGHVSILSGVSIGKGCIVAAGSVVTKDVEDFSIVAGVPAHKISDNNPDSGVNVQEQYGLNR
jgi:maltose O-acetyltransferase